VIKIETIKCSYISGKKCHYIPKGLSRKEIIDDLLNHLFKEHDELIEPILIKSEEVIRAINKLIPSEAEIKNKK